MSCLRIGHRGAAGHAPGNTILSIEKALGIGVDVIEIDVQRTRDGHLIVLHDRYLQSASPGKRYVGDLSLDEIRRLRTRSEDEPMPTLMEVLERVSGRAGLMIEIKASGITEIVEAIVREAGFRGSLFYASFLHAEILSIRARDSSAITIALLEGVPVEQTAFARDAQATHAGLAIGSLSNSFVRKLDDAGFRVFTYTVDEPEEIVYARACNVDGIISNYPDRL